jgi:GT2 family glycosyltransferase
VFQHSREGKKFLKPPKIYVIILNWNLPQETLACVRSVEQSSLDHFQMVVVDNGSTDNSPDLFKQQLRGNPLLISSKNLGYAGGNNLGIRWALKNKADYVLLLNNDTLVDSRMIEFLLGAAESDPNVGILSPAIYYYDDPGRIWRLGAVQPDWWLLPREVGRNAVDNNQYRQTLSVDFVTGCAMWIKCALFEDVGLLDERFFMYYEDADFCVRARHKGWRIKVVPEAKIWHKVSRSLSRQASLASFYRIRNRLVFYNRHYGRCRRWIITSYIFMQVLAQFLVGGTDRKYLWAGFRDGLRNVTGEKDFSPETLNPF